jgi:hypothetical protein
MNESGLPLDEPFRLVTTDLLNIAFSVSSSAQAYWTDTIAPALVSQFNLEKEISTGKKSFQFLNFVL